jgi:hypothetical protein
LIRRLLIAFALLSASSAFAQFDIPTQIQRGVSDADVRNKVAQYCRLDYQGARLSEQGFQKLKPVVNWTSNPEYPLIDVVSRYDVNLTVVPERGKWGATVTYHLLGRFNLGQGYTLEAAGSDKEVAFTVQEVNGELKVVDNDPNYPRPSRAAMLKWLQDKQAAADEKTKIIYDQAIKELSAQSGSPFAR